MEISAEEKKEETKEGLAWGRGVWAEGWKGGVDQGACCSSQALYNSALG